MSRPPAPYLALIALHILLATAAASLLLSRRGRLDRALGEARAREIQKLQVEIGLSDELSARELADFQSRIEPALRAEHLQSWSYFSYNAVLHELRQQGSGLSCERPDFARLTRILETIDARQGRAARSDLEPLLSQVQSSRSTRNHRRTRR